MHKKQKQNKKINNEKNSNFSVIITEKQPKYSLFFQKIFTNDDAYCGIFNKDFAFFCLIHFDLETILNKKKNSPTKKLSIHLETI